MEVLAVEHRNAKLVRRQLIDIALTSVGLIYLTLCHYLPDYLSSPPARNPGCQMNLLWWNDMYAVCFLVPSLFSNLYFVSGY